MRSSLSDLICKGVLPKYYFISGSGNKKTFTKKNLSKISNSLKQEQKKYGIFLCGGDTTFSNRLSFSITSIGYSKNIVFRNKAKLHDDIYVTGNLGDSFVGLKILQNKINTTKKFKSYFKTNNQKMIELVKFRTCVEVKPSANNLSSITSIISFSFFKFVLYLFKTAFIVLLMSAHV